MQTYLVMREYLATTTFRAFDKKEMDAIIAKMDDAI